MGPLGAEKIDIATSCSKAEQGDEDAFRTLFNFDQFQVLMELSQRGSREVLGPRTMEIIFERILRQWVEQHLGADMVEVIASSNTRYTMRFFDELLHDEAGKARGEIETYLPFSEVEQGHEFSVRRLVEIGADVKARDIDGRTVLHHLPHTNIEMTRFLISSGADVNANQFKMPPIHQLWGGPELGTKAVISFLLEHGAHINATDFWRRTPLFYSATEDSHHAWVHFFLEHGGDIDVVDNDAKWLWTLKILVILRFRSFCDLHFAMDATRYLLLPPCCVTYS